MAETNGLATTVVLVEDHALTRAGLRTALAAQGIAVIGEAADGVAGADMIIAQRPDVAVVDLGLPGKDGVAVTHAVKSSGTPTKIVILTMHELEDEIFAALGAGADAYCVKSSDASVAVEAVRIAASGGAFFDPRIAHVVLRRLGGKTSDSQSASPLTPRELEILRLIADGFGNGEIAQRLYLGLGTVKGHVRDILEKLAATDRTQAAVTALRRGWI
ncbi:MAG: response regulator transcription factor [Candidatus Eremiobacteraeota bacterium]|nr:response regulator transcription factor [Candidatus Eremiobacteraeota bacterium]